MLTLGRAGERRSRSESRLPRSAFAEEDLDPALRIQTTVQLSTLFFSSRSAVSVMTRSPMRLITPMTGMLRSSVSS